MIDDLGSGGAQRQMVNLALALAERGNNITFAVYMEKEYYEEILRNNNIEVVKLIVKKPVKRIFAFRRYIRNNNFDAVISFLGVPNFICELAAIPTKKWKLIVNERSANPVITRSFNSIFRRIFHLFADIIICNSYSNKDIVQKVNPFIKNKIRIIYNGIDTKKWKPDSNFKFLRDGFLHVIVASSHRYLKNFIGLLRALLLLSEGERNKIRISWYGDRIEPPYYDGSIVNCIKYIKDNNLENMIDLHPATQDICKKMQNADVVALFSFFEGLPNAICEGMALGKPILASAVSDIPLFINDEVNGKLCNPYDVQSIADAIRFFLIVGRLRLMQIGDLNRKKATELFDNKKILSQFLEVIE
ncbi:MAG: glycosyltransferase [Bacteroidota bacterium]